MTKKMPKFNYIIEYNWKLENQLISLVILCDVSQDNDLIGLTDEIYNLYKKKYKDVRIYYFTSKGEATDYVYLRLVQKRDEEDTLQNSGCVGNLENRKLTGRMSPPKLLKTYHY